MNNKVQIDLKIPEVFKPVIESDPLVYPYISLPGGRGSGKSYTVGVKAILRALESPIKILFTREFQNSIKDSSYQVLVDTIHRLGVQSLFKINKTEIIGMNGSRISFKGLKTNISSIKSFEDVGLCVIEEAESISEESWSALIPTIRSLGSQIIIIFNPASEEDPTYKRWVADPLPGTLIIKSTYRDNSYLTDKFIKEMEHMKENDYNQYLNVYEGEPLQSDDLSIIKPEWFNAAIDAHKVLNFQPEGLEVIGFDPNDSGSDAAAITHRHGSVVMNLIEISNKTVEECTKDSYTYAKDNMIDNIVYDCIGVGVGSRVTYNTLDPQSKLTITPFDARLSATTEMYRDTKPGNQYFKNIRAQEITKLADRFRNTWLAVIKGKYINPDELISISSEIDPKLIKQLKYECTHIRNKANSNFITIESKDDMKSRGLKSPNLFDSLYYSFAPIKDNNPEIIHLEFNSWF